MEANTNPFTPGFGQFHGIPQRTLPDDCVEYTLIIIDQTSDQTAIRAELEKVKQTAEKFVKEVTADYIWQRGSFQLELAEAKAVGWYLHGKTEYGDSVDDEWLIVWILRELTRDIPNLWFQSGSRFAIFLMDYSHLVEYTIPTASFCLSRLQAPFHVGSSLRLLVIGY